MIRQKIEPDEETDDNEYVLAAQKRLSDFEPLYQRYVQRVYLYLRTRTDNGDDAADLTQQVFLHALNALPAYRIRGVPFSAWLFRIARHIVIDRYRRHSPMTSWDLLPEALQQSEEQGPEMLFMKQETFLHLRNFLNSLDPYKRELLALRFAAELSSAEIAEVVGKSPAAVKKQLTRIMNNLKEHYHEK